MKFRLSLYFRGLPAIEFGIRYFHSHWRMGLTAHLNDVRFLQVDTTYAAMMYATVQCLCEALTPGLELVKLEGTREMIMKA